MSPAFISPVNGRMTSMPTAMPATPRRRSERCLHEHHPHQKGARCARNPQHEELAPPLARRQMKRKAENQNGEQPDDADKPVS